MSHVTAAQIAANADRLAKDALHTCVALDLVASRQGRTWRPVCCLCVDAIEVRLGVEIEAYRINTNRGHDTGWCSSCSYSGRDVLVASLEMP